jgi:uncharacterized protein
MSLREQIDKGIKEAMLGKKKDELKALRSIKSMILLAATKEGAESEIKEEDEVTIIKKAAKQRRDSIQIYKDQGRDDLADEETLELSVIERFLPTQMSEEQIEQLVKEVIEELGAEGMKDFSKVMPAAIKKAAGMTDNRLIADIGKRLLGA